MKCFKCNNQINNENNLFKCYNCKNKFCLNCLNKCNEFDYKLFYELYIKNRKFIYFSFLKSRDMRKIICCKITFYNFETFNLFNK